MANTIAISASLAIKRTGDVSRLLFQRSNSQFTQSGEGLASGIQNVGTSAEAIGIGDVGTEGYAVFENLDATNYVEIGWDATGFQEAFKLLPGQFAIVPLAPSRTWQAKANTAAVELFFAILEA
jgi:hypothetical protein